MTFNSQTYDFVIKAIEDSMAFNKEESNLKEGYAWEIKINLSIQQLINARPDSKEEIMFIINTLRDFKYITTTYGDFSIVNSRTPDGCKFLFDKHYHVKL